MLKKTLTLAALLAGLAMPALASDDDGSGHRERYEHGRYEQDGDRCSARRAAEWLSVDEVAKKLKEEGYTVRRIEASHGCYEVKVTDSKGVRLEMHVDPATAEVIGRDGRS